MLQPNYVTDQTSRALSRNDERSAVEASLPVRERVDNEFLYILMTSSRQTSMRCAILTMMQQTPFVKRKSLLHYELIGTQTPFVKRKSLLHYELIGTVRQTSMRCAILTMMQQTPFVKRKSLLHYELIGTQTPFVNRKSPMKFERPVTYKAVLSYAILTMIYETPFVNRKSPLDYEIPCNYN
ncbi:hypothetical protein J6590_083716 [Homalodisca vitripennis]|nr:hypothetical protein J6590_083716 [Homalodisca vitripennis]